MTGSALKMRLARLLAASRTLFSKLSFGKVSCGKVSCGKVLSCKPLSLRFARMSDAGRLALLHAQGFERGWRLAEFEQLLTDAASVCLIADAKPATEAAGLAVARVAADEAEILSIVVARRMRRGGLATRLLGQLLSGLRQRGIRLVFLEVGEDNVAAIALYANFGFVAVGKRDAYYKRDDGSTPAALVMRLDLDRRA